jgi:uridine phosphorylase
VTRPPLHLRPTTDLADRVLLPGDPGRALMLAQELLTEPKMFNHHRGLWGYTGMAADGELLTVQATGMGGPSAATVFEELVDLGVTRAIRVGTCGALDPSLTLGALVVADAALSADGASRALGSADRAPADGALTAGLDGDARGLIVSTDLFYDPRDTASAWRELGALAVEMEAAALLTIGERREVAVGCVCVVSNVVGAGEWIDDDALEAAAKRAGRAAQNALVSTNG